MSAPDKNRIAGIKLDQGSIVRWSREVDHERQVAIFDLLENNSFALVDGFEGPYRIELSLRDANLIVAVAGEDGDDQTEITLSMRPFRKLIKDYFLICEAISRPSAPPRPAGSRRSTWAGAACTMTVPPCSWTR